MSPLTDDFDGSYGAGLSLTITTPGGSPVEVPIQGIKDIDFPDKSFKLDKYTPISGVRAGREQVVICSQESSEIPATLVYEKEHQIAMHDITGINNCAIVLLLADGLTLTGSGGIFRMGIERITDSQHISTQFTFALEAGWTLVDAGDTVFTPEYTVTMSAGAFTIDLTACGSGGAQDLSGNYVSRIRLTNPAANSNPIQVAEGAANGYDLTNGESFDVTLSPDTNLDTSWASGDEIDGTAKTLDLTGTGSETLQVYIESKPV